MKPDSLNQYPVILIQTESEGWDDSKVIGTQIFTLDDGRPVTAQAWAEAGSTYLTYFFSDKNLEGKSSEELITYLVGNGISSGTWIEKQQYTVSSSKDSNGEPYWNVTLTLGEGDD
ncbi:MAG: hypothetical protein AB9903_22250 [Vulcanimicrobiota bacterium]